ncbi:MAG: fluoride efflux transporter CrcB [Gemmatimonadetes bacterium]|nr:fluoride efflux transporter CrcB [Gemmatimonadota bacterium]
MNSLAVAAGGATGATLRYLVSLWVVRGHADAFPWATLFVNLVGSFLLGAVVVYATETSAFSQPLRLFLTVGLCGGFTTMSSFAYETLDFAARGLAGRALLYALASLVLSVLAVFAGGALAQWLAGR